MNKFKECPECKAHTLEEIEPNHWRCWNEWSYYETLEAQIRGQRTHDWCSYEEVTV